MTAPDPAVPIADDPQRCPVCPHRKADHDAIAQRFCSAKGASVAAHGCVCRPTG